MKDGGEDEAKVVLNIGASVVRLTWSAGTEEEGEERSESVAKKRQCNLFTASSAKTGKYMPLKHRLTINTILLLLPVHHVKHFAHYIFHLLGTLADEVSNKRRRANRYSQLTNTMFVPENPKTI